MFTKIQALCFVGFAAALVRCTVTEPPQPLPPVPGPHVPAPGTRHVAMFAPVTGNVVEILLIDSQVRS